LIDIILPTITISFYYYVSKFNLYIIIIVLIIKVLTIYSDLKENEIQFHSAKNYDLHQFAYL